MHLRNEINQGHICHKYCELYSLESHATGFFVQLRRF